MSKIRRIGLTPDPPGGWPLDHLFVGIATLRILRELFSRADPQRAWDLHLRTGVSPQGSADALDRLARLGLADILTYNVPGEARWYRIAPSHPLEAPLGGLFLAERDEARKRWRAVRRPERAATDGATWRGGSGPPA